MYGICLSGRMFRSLQSCWDCHARARRSGRCWWMLLNASSTDSGSMMVANAAFTPVHTTCLSGFEYFYRCSGGRRNPHLYVCISSARNREPRYLIKDSRRSRYCPLHKRRDTWSLELLHAATGVFLCPLLCRGISAWCVWAWCGTWGRRSCDTCLQTSSGSDMNSSIRFVLVTFQNSLIDCSHPCLVRDRSGSQLSLIGWSSHSTRNHLSAGVPNTVLVCLIMKTSSVADPFAERPICGCHHTLTNFSWSRISCPCLSTEGACVVSTVMSPLTKLTILKIVSESPRLSVSFIFVAIWSRHAL